MPSRRFTLPSRWRAAPRIGRRSPPPLRKIRFVSSSDTPIRTGRITALRIPTDQPNESDGTAVWDSTGVVIVELTAAEITGLAFAYANTAAAPVAKELLEEVVLKRDPFAIPALPSALDIQPRNWGRPGLVSSAISAIDTCLWDLKARLFDRPLL